MRRRGILAGIARRDFLVSTAVAIAALDMSGPAAAQEAKIPRLGVLLVGSREPFWGLFGEGLNEFGYREGQNVVIDVRSSEGRSDILPALAAELVGLKPDIIVASETPAVEAAKRATAEIPIVMAAAGDPVGTGLIASLARPGGNVTGLSAATAEIAGKSLELIREIMPSSRCVGVLALAGNPLTKPFLEQIELAAKALNFEIRPALIRSAEDIDAAFLEMRGGQVDAVILQPSVPHRRPVELALQYRLPAVSVTRAFPEAGGLMSYAGNLDERYRGAAVYVDAILRGAKPADLPVRQPTKFELVINLKTAKALGLTIPPSLLATADALIE